MQADDFLLVNWAPDPTPPIRPWQPCVRTYSGNLCGIYLPYLPPVPGGAANPQLFLSWFYDRYDPAIRARILADYKSRGFTDLLLSWPDSRSVGATPASFGDLCDEVYQAGLEPCVMLVSKDYDSGTLTGLMNAVNPVVPVLKQRVGRICVGWELNSFISPEVLHQFIDWLAPQIVPWGGKLYVHFTAGVAAWQENGFPFAKFWNDHVGQLTGLLWQADVDWTPSFLQAKCKDILDRFAGQDFCAPDSGFGHPFDCIGLELQAMHAYWQNESETQQNIYAEAVMATEPTDGPFGPVRCLGSGNGVG